MFVRIITLFSFLFLFSATPSVIHAQPTAKAEESKSAEEGLAEIQSDTLKQKMTSLMRTLTQEEINHFLVMYTNYNVYSMVKAVQEDISGAIDGCIKNNKNMEGDLTKRFDSWKKNVGTTMKEANANIQNLALAQTYLSQDEVQGFFSLIDEVRAHNSSRFETTPVTTPEACEFMISKMDETEENMKQLLQVALASYPNVLRKTQK